MAGAVPPLPRFSLLRTAAVQLTLLYLVLVAVTGSALLTLVHTMSVGLLNRETDESIQRELQFLSAQLRRSGPRTLRHLVEDRSYGQTTSLYLLSFAGQPTLTTGNLDSWPTGDADPNGWVNFNYSLPERGGLLETRAARAQIVLLQPGLQILVGRDIQGLRMVEGRFTESFLWAGGIVLVLGFAGGALIARQTLLRVNRINSAARNVLVGDLTQRLPERGSGDELDRLAGTFNIMMERIEGLVKNLQEVTDNIAHDLRTPLHRLRSGLEAALLDANDSAKQQHALDRAIAEADQLIETFNGLLEIAQLESGVKPKFEPVDLALLVRELAEIYEPVADDSGLALFVHAEETPCVCSGHRTLLAQSLSNLLDNAIKYSSPGGSIRVAVRVTPAGDGELIVADDGPGIPASERRRVLDRFVRLSTSRDLPGSGLGLSLVAAVVRLHEGALSLEDNGPGLRIRIRLPGTRPADPPGRQLTG